MSEIEILNKLYSNGKISRREFIVKTSALGLSVAVSPVLLSKKAQAAKPKKGGIVKIGWSDGSVSDSLDPSLMNQPFPMLMSYFIWDKLVDLDINGVPRSELAESFEPSADLKTWTIKIRKGVEFHNGKTVDSEDVVASLNYHRKEDSKSDLKALFSPVLDIKKDGKHVVVIKLNQSYADFPHLLAWRAGVICPAKDDSIHWKKGIGTGAYILKEFEPGVRAFLEKNPNHWNQDIGHFDQVELLVITDTAARTNALITKKIDIMDKPDLKTASKLNNMSGLRVEETASYAHMHMPMLTDVPPFDNKNLRLALKHAIDRNALMKTVFKGHGTVGNDHPISPAHQFFAKELPQRQYDPDKAKYYWKKSGYGNTPLKFHTADAGSPGGIDAALLFKEHASKAGINIDVVRVPDDGYWSDIWRVKPWCMCYWSGRSSEDMMFSTAYAAESKHNDTRWKNERFNKLLLEARGERDNNKRREMYFEMQKLVNEDGGTVIPIFFNWVFACNDKLQHLPGLHGDSQVDGYRIADRWWFES
jgi:peptide/nickel transport system substrate-binding protein